MKNPLWQNVVHHLREELSAYGGVLHLFSSQQRALMERNPASVLQFSTEIEALVPELAEHRRRRSEAVIELALSLGQPNTSTLRSLLPFVEQVARPLLEALMGEVNRLVFKLRRVNKHNHTLITRLVESQRDMLRQLKPTAFTQTYAADGQTRAGLPNYTSLQAAG